MKVYREISVSEFEAWSGAVDTLQTLEDKGLMEQAEQAIEDYFSDCGEDCMDETALNDFLWFETDFIAQMLGFTDWEHLESGESEDAEEDEDEEDE